MMGKDVTHAATLRLRALVDDWVFCADVAGHGRDVMWRFNDHNLSATDLEIVLAAAEGAEIQDHIERLSGVVERWQTCNSRQRDSIGRLVKTRERIRMLVESDVDDRTKVDLIQEALSV
jgi:hypothetical protein